MGLKQISAAALVLATLHAVPGLAAERQPAFFGDGSVFGPVTLGSEEGLRLCHANAFGDGSVRAVWVLYRLVGDGSVKPVAVQRVEVEPGKGGCMDLAALKFFDGAPSANAFDGQSVSLFAILIGLRSPHRRPVELTSSVQRFVMADDGSITFGLLLPAVQKSGWLLPAIPTGD